MYVSTQYSHLTHSTPKPRIQQKSGSIIRVMDYPSKKIGVEEGSEVGHHR